MQKRIEGPFGLHMTDEQATSLDELIKTMPKGTEEYTPQTLAVSKALSELLEGERADVSWISTEANDRYKDIVLAKGMDETHYKLNPIVTLNHNCWGAPAGKSIWRKKIKDGEKIGIKAKTSYTPRPANWPVDEPWTPDYAYSMVKAGLLLGKSISFLPKKISFPSDDDVEKNPLLKGVRRIIEEWVLLEYACCYMPCQGEAVVTEIPKSLGIPAPILKSLGFIEASEPIQSKQIAFTTLETYRKAIEARIEAALDPKKIVESRLDKIRGRV